MHDRKKQKDDFSKRGTVQSHKRMQIIAELGDEEQFSPNKPEKTRDNFGVDDEDWDVYRDIQKDGFSEDEEDDQQALNEIEDKISELDKNFNMMLYKAGQEGHRPAKAEDYQIRLWADRYRGAEVLF